jgi:hypothetical protein
MNGLPRPDFNNTSPQVNDRFNTPSPLKPIKIGPTQNPQVNRVRNFEAMITDAEAQHRDNVYYMTITAKKLKELDLNK